MGNILKLTRPFALNFITRSAKQLFVLHDVPYSLNSDLSIHDAKTYSSDDNRAVKVDIGVYEIQEAKRSFPYAKQPVISDEDFTNVIINMYHERMHCIQKNQLFRESSSSKFIKYQAVQEIACMDNPDYYFNDGNYFINANEIQAEEYGILKGYQYLLKAFPDIDPKQLETIVLNVVNNKMQTSSYFVNQSESFTSLSEVEDAFD